MRPFTPVLLTAAFTASANSSVETQPYTEKPLALALPTYFTKFANVGFDRRFLERQVTERHVRTVHHVGVVRDRLVVTAWCIPRRCSGSVRPWSWASLRNSTALLSAIVVSE